MPNKNLHADEVPIAVVSRLAEWGTAIRSQRLTQQIRASDLCARAGVSEATLRRIEKGDPMAGVGAVLSLLNVLALLPHATPSLPEWLLQEPSKERVRLPRASTDDEDF